MADTFTDFVQNLFPSLGQVQQPMLTSTFTDPSAYRMSPEAAAYYADPFRKQNAIQQASLDAALKKKQADEAAQRLSGMLSGGGDGGMETGLTQSQIDFLNDEAMTPGARDARMSNINNILTTAVPALFGLPSPSIIGGMFNLGRQGVANMFNLSQQPAPVVNMSSPGGTAVSVADLSNPATAYTGITDFSYDGGGGGVSSPDAGSVNIGGVDVGYGGGYGGGGSDGGGFGGMAGNTGSADAPW
jgi:hypothetical protein